METKLEDRQSLELDTTSRGYKRRYESTSMVERRPIFPPYAGENVIDWHIYNRLGRIWNSENRVWTISEKMGFVAWVEDARVTETTCTIAEHPLSKKLASMKPSWGHFVVLRVMFGSSACSRQPWWEEFKSRYPGATHDAPPGVVPAKRDDCIEAIRDNEMNVPSTVPIPIVGRCRGIDGDDEFASSPARGALTQQGNRGVPLSQEEEQDKIEIIEAINIDAVEDPGRFDREPGVEPGAEETDPEWSEFMASTQAIKSRSKRNAEAIKKLTTHIRKQDQLINELVELAREQQEKMEVMEAKMESMVEVQKKTEEWHKCADGRMRALRTRIERKGGVEEWLL